MHEKHIVQVNSDPVRVRKLYETNTTTTLNPTILIRQAITSHSIKTRYFNQRNKKITKQIGSKQKNPKVKANKARKRTN